MEKFQGFTPICDNIWYLPASTPPLSADVGLVQGLNSLWLFDAGSDDNSFNLIKSLPEPVNCIISHFHEDHTDNLSRLTFQNLYVGSSKYMRTRMGKEIKEPVVFNDGIRIEIKPLPSCHSPDALMMIVDDQYAFLGDGIYCGQRKGKNLYNAQKLQEEIKCLEQTDVKYFCLSHQRRFVREKEDVVSKLKYLYSQRNPSSPWIEIHSWW